jgi:phage shock protein A
MAEPENLVLQLLREMRDDLAGVREGMATKAAVGDLRSDVQSLRADVASDLLTIEKRMSEQIVGLRRAVMEYHSSAIGHGILISELEERLRRVEQHLNLPSAEAH